MSSPPAQKPRACSTPNNLLHILRRTTSTSAQNFRGTLFRNRLDVAKNLYKKDLISHFGCVNAIEFNASGEYLISGGDDRRVLLWNVEKALADKSKPRSMDKQHLSNIFCLSFNNDNTKIFSGGNDDTVILHDMKTGDAIDVFFHNKPVYGLSVSTENDNIFSTAGEDGRVLLFDLRTNTEAMNVVKYRAPFHGVMFHPQDGNFIITANAKEGAGFWDLRSQKMPVIRYGGEDASQSCMSVRFNALGTQVLALRRRLPPILYRTEIPEPICQFYHSDYYNSCTMKSCSFAGEFDEFVLSGSDDFNLYCWRVDDADMEKRNQWLDRTQMVLFGHRSIVNQVRYNYQKCLIASSGVEKIIKVWSPFAEDKWSGSLVEESQGENPRDVFTHEEYMSLMHTSGQNMTHDYTNQNTTEDPRMMAFFDYLVQQEIEGWDSESSDHSSEHSSENSSRPCSSQSSSDEEVNSVNYLGGPSRAARDLSCRRGDTNTTRTKYRNRIAYLIATKRNTLKRLALKNANRTTRRIKNKYNGGRQQAKQTRNSLRMTRKMAGKRVRRVSSHKYTKRPASREQTSDSEVPKTMVKKRRHIQQHLNSSNYRTFRRKTKTPLSSTSNTSTRLADESNTSSDDDEEFSGIGNGENVDDETVMPTCSKTLLNGDLKRKTAATSSSTSAIPSTSTGITGSKSLMFRIVQQQADSDDDDDDDRHSIPETTVDNSTIRVITSPVNGFNGTYTNYYTQPHQNQPSHLHNDYFDNDDVNNNNTESLQEILNNNNNNTTQFNNNNHNNNNHHPVNGTHNNNVASTQTSPTTVNNRSVATTTNSSTASNSRKRPAYDQSVDSSHSNSRLSSSYQEDGSTSNDSFIEYFNKKRKFFHGSNNMTPVNPSSTLYPDNSTPTHINGLLHTDDNPNHLIEVRDILNYTPDSGIATTTYSSGSIVGGTSSYKPNSNSTQTPENGNAGRSGSSISNSNGVNNQKSSYTSKLFQQKIAKVRKNYRNNFGDDSDSD